MKVRFLQDYQGQHTGPHFYRAGQVVELDDATASRLVTDKRAQPVPQPKQTTITRRRRSAKKGTK